MKTLFAVVVLMLGGSASHAAESAPPRVKMRPKLRSAPTGHVTAEWRRAGGLAASGKVSAFEHRVLQRMARLPKLEVQKAGELVSHTKDSFGYPIRYALERSGDSLNFTITRHNAYRDLAARVSFRQGPDGVVEREVHLKAPGLEALFRRGQNGDVRVIHSNGSLASGTNGFAEVPTDPATVQDLALLRSVFSKRNAEFKETPFDKWYWHAAGY